jgi:hypothetical protein
MKRSLSSREPFLRRTQELDLVWQGTKMAASPMNVVRSMLEDVLIMFPGMRHLPVGSRVIARTDLFILASRCLQGELYRLYLVVGSAARDNPLIGSEERTIA